MFASAIKAPIIIEAVKDVCNPLADAVLSELYKISDKIIKKIRKDKEREIFFFKFKKKRMAIIKVKIRKLAPPIMSSSPKKLLTLSW